MLDKLKKALGGKEAAKPVEQLEVKLDTTEVQAAIDAAVATVSAEFGEFKTSAEAAMLEAAEKITSLEAALAEANAALEAANADKAQAVVDAAALKAAARKEKVIAAVGTERAPALLTVTEGMEDAAFDAVLSALSTGAKAEAESPLFTEVGVDAQADTAKVVESESAEMKILKAKYKPKKK